MAEEKKQDLIKYGTEKGDVTLSIGIIKNYLDPSGKVSREEAMLFMKLCQYHKLNPFLREAYIIKYSDKQAASLVVGKETFTKRAEKHPQFDGLKAGIFVVNLENKLEKRVGSFYLENEAVVGGWAEVWRKDKKQTDESSVTMREYAGRKNDGSLTRMWASKPATMIRKVALVQALREAFPDSFQGMYVEEEMEDANKVAEDFTMPSEMPTKLKNGENLKSGEAEDAETEPASDLDKAAEAGWQKSEKEGPAPTTPKQAEGKSTFEQIFAVINTWKQHSRILPYAKRTREAKDNEEELLKILEEIKGE